MTEIWDCVKNDTVLYLFFYGNVQLFHFFIKKTPLKAEIPGGICHVMAAFFQAASDQIGFILADHGPEAVVGLPGDDGDGFGTGNF